MQSDQMHWSFYENHPVYHWIKTKALVLPGKMEYRFIIDGRVTPLSGADLAIYLKTLQSSQIESIELITNPSAKYDAAGNAGIINIRLKKNKAFGTNGSVNAGWNVGTYAKYNGGASLNYRNKNTTSLAIIVSVTDLINNH